MCCVAVVSREAHCICTLVIYCVMMLITFLKFRKSDRSNCVSEEPWWCESITRRVMTKYRFSLCWKGSIVYCWTILQQRYRLRLMKTDDVYDRNAVHEVTLKSFEDTDLSVMYELLHLNFVSMIVLNVLRIVTEDIIQR